MQEEILKIDKENINDFEYANNKKIIKIIISKNVKNIGNSAFINCTNLNEVIFEESDTTLGKEVFKNCTNLTKVILPENLEIIPLGTFENCNNLTYINLPNNIKKIEKYAFKNCYEIKELKIPNKLTEIEFNTFINLYSLEKIYVSKDNKVFYTPDNQILINEKNQSLILYASACKDKYYSLMSYCKRKDENDIECIYPITSINEYAFSGSKNLEELTIPSSIQKIDITTFNNCTNLKILNIQSLSFYSFTVLNMVDCMNYYIDENLKNINLPFEVLNFIGSMYAINGNFFEYLTNLKNLILPNIGKCNILPNVFKNSTLLDKVYIPNNITLIEDSFNEKTKLIFNNNLELLNLKKYQYEKNEFLSKYYKLYTLNDDEYIIEYDDIKLNINKKQIRDLGITSTQIFLKPTYLIDFIEDLRNNNVLDKYLINDDLITNLQISKRQALINLLKEDKYFYINAIRKTKILENTNMYDDECNLEIIKHKFDIFLDYIKFLKNNNIENELLYDKLLINNYDIDALKNLIINDYELLIKTLLYSNLTKTSNIGLMYDDKVDMYKSFYLAKKITSEESITPFINLIKKYNIKDRYLFQKTFIYLSKNKLMDELFSVYDANTKRLLQESNFYNLEISSIENLNDLLVLMKILGALDKNEVTRQRASTFITEKLFLKTLPNNEENKFCISGNKIHEIFDFSLDDYEYNEKFALFFMENYKELLLTNKNLIKNIYTNFEQIAKTHTSNKGSQRQLKVTLEKCISYLSNILFVNVSDEYIELAFFLTKWFSNDETLNLAIKILNESKKAPRNIFTKYIVNENNELIFDNNPIHDLKENGYEDYTYEWLPKQSYDNLVLGKYCNCCAHIEGAGMSIVVASMLNENCQNIVIRNNNDEIIAKANLYIDRKNGYGVYNTFAMSNLYDNEISKQKIYDAFIRGSIMFFKEYNKNNPNNKITTLTIGTNRNKIIEYFNENINVLNSINYAKYSKEKIGKYTLYSCDWETGQKLVLRRTK